MDNLEMLKQLLIDCDWDVSDIKSVGENLPSTTIDKIANYLNEHGVVVKVDCYEENVD